jgi:hypothetical protein
MLSTSRRGGGAGSGSGSGAGLGARSTKSAVSIGGLVFDVQLKGLRREIARDATASRFLKDGA